MVGFRDRDYESVKWRTLKRCLRNVAEERANDKEKNDYTKKKISQW